MTRVKICGLTRECDLRPVVRAGADAVGVTADVTVDTPREVPVERAADLVEDTPPMVSTVLVTMPSTTERARELVETVEPDAVQVHGGLSRGELDDLGSAVPADVIAVADADDPTRARHLDAVADAVLVDSVDESGGGGTGRTHDWERTRAVTRDLESPVVLAGGLTPDNVASAVRTVEPFAVDVASGVERSSGIKDHDAVERFVATAKDADAGSVTDADATGHPEVER
jgi:phosphoribosylanthranilate isomerase